MPFNKISASQGAIRHVLISFSLICAMLFSVAAPAQAFTFPSGYPRMGTVEESVPGHVLEFTKGSKTLAINTRLFPVYTAAGSTPNQFAYCIESNVSAGFNAGLQVGGWSAFPGDNNFKSSLQVREKVAWIVYNSYPNRALDEVATAAGLTDPSALTEKEAIAATQGAIWTLTDGLNITKGKDLSSDSNARVMQLLNYLKGEANTGRAEVLEAKLTVSAIGAQGVAGTRVGPLMLSSSEDFVAVTASSAYPVVFADGSPVDLTQVPGNSQLFVEVPAHAESGQTSFSVELTGSKFTGLLVINKTGNEHKQTLMISASDEVKVRAEANVSWTAQPKISTTAVDAADGDKYLAQNGAVTVLDTVNYEGLVPGTEYTISGELMVKGVEGPEQTGITATKKFTPESASGSVDLTFEVPSAQLSGQTIVVYERLYLGETEIASHVDINDANQTVFRPAIETDAFDLADLDQQLSAAGGTLRDTVTYSGLTPGVEYSVNGEVMDKETGESTGIASGTTFVAETSSGTVNVDFAIPADLAGKTLVVFEYLHRSENVQDNDDSSGSGAPSKPLAEHTNINDLRQTVNVDSPLTPPSTPPAVPPTSGELPLEIIAAPEQPEAPTSGVLSNSVEAPNSDLAQTGFGSMFAALIGAFFLIVGTLFVMSRKRRNN